MTSAPHSAPCCDLHRVDVWELLLSHLWHSSFQKNVPGHFNRNAGNNYLELGKTGEEVLS